MNKLLLLLLFFLFSTALHASSEYFKPGLLDSGNNKYTTSIGSLEESIELHVAATKVQSSFRGFASRQAERNLDALVAMDVKQEKIIDSYAKAVRIDEFGNKTINRLELQKILENHSHVIHRDSTTSSEGSFVSSDSLSVNCNSTLDEENAPKNLADLIPAEFVKHNKNYFKKFHSDEYHQTRRQKKAQEAAGLEALRVRQEAYCNQAPDEEQVQSFLADLTPSRLAELVEYPQADKYTNNEFKEALRRKAVQDPAAVKDLLHIAQQNVRYYQYLLNIGNE